MLTELHIRDFAIIEDLRLPLGPGFIVFTGETGAGKSIMIDAVEMVLGGRADSTLVRAGADLSNVEGTFSLDDRTRQEVAAILAREGLEDDGGYMTVGREIRSEGRSICRVNGRTVNLALLKELGEWLVDVHGQSEHLQSAAGQGACRAAGPIRPGRRVKGSVQPGLSGTARGQARPGQVA